MRIRTHKPMAVVLAFLQLQDRCNLHDSYHLAWSSGCMCVMVVIIHQSSF
jgi:hypothetical protein